MPVVVFFLRFCLYKLKNALYLHSLKKNCSFTQCENSSVGRARPCPGIIKSDLGKTAFQKSKCINAKIAQLVEHDLAKVGVAGSSPVFRSLYRDARMVELVDTQDLKSCGHCGCAGSSPASSTPKIRKSNIVRLPFFMPSGGVYYIILGINFWVKIRLLLYLSDFNDE